MKTSFTAFFILITHIIVFAAETDVLIIYTNNTNGILQNCNCPDHAYGALEKRAYVIDSLRQEVDYTILLDGGDILDIRRDTILHGHILDAYARMNYDYWVAGDQDFVEGSEFFEQITQTAHLTLLNTNIFKDDTLPGIKYDIKQMDHVKIGFTGTIRPDLHQYLDQDCRSLYNFSDQIKALTGVIEFLEKQTDFLILLSQSGFENDRIVAQKYPQIDLIVGGHSQTRVTEPGVEGKTLIVQAGESGYHVGILKLSFRQKKLESYHNELYLLDKSVPDDARVIEIINRYQQERLNKVGKTLHIKK